MSNLVPESVEHKTCYLQGQDAALRGERRNCWWLKGRQKEDWLLGYDDAVPRRVEEREESRQDVPPFDPSTQGQTVFVAVKIGSAGSSGGVDVLFGDHKVQLPNEALLAAGRRYLSIITAESDAVTEQPSEYDVRINTVTMFGGEEEFGE
jgi:hypothetical protein